MNEDCQSEQGLHLMVKVKHKQMGPVVKKNGKSFGGLLKSSKIGIEGDLHEDDEWVIVKKQKITILIPPATLPIQTTHKILRTHQVVTKPRRTIHPRKRSSDDRKYSLNGRSLSVKSNLRRNLTRPTLKTAEASNYLAEDSMVHRLSPTFVHDHRGQGPSKAFRVSGIPKAVKRSVAPQSSWHLGPRLSLRPIGCLNMAALQNRMMRASNLERKLEKAGGVSRWLVSLGLGRFVNLFHRKNVDKFQLLNLTMGKLKEMGATAVGPRRKLIHAIDCLSQPCCFGTL